MFILLYLVHMFICKFYSSADITIMLMTKFQWKYIFGSLVQKSSYWTLAAEFIAPVTEISSLKCSSFVSSISYDPPIFSVWVRVEGK